MFYPVSPSIKSPFPSWDFFTIECLFNTIVSLSTLSSGQHSSLFYTMYAGKTSLATMIVLFFISDGNSYWRNASNTCAVASISSISGVTSTDVQSFGVRADSIHVTRVISFTLVNIWETIYIFGLYHVCHFKMGLSRVITLIIVNNKTYFVFFLFALQIRYLKRIFHHEYYNLSTRPLWNSWLVPAPSPPPPQKKKKKKN